MHESSAHTEFAADYNRKNMRKLAGDVGSRAHLFAHWDEVLPYRRLNAAAEPYVFEQRLTPLDVSYEHDGASHTIDSYVERNDVAALLVIADGAVVHERYRLGTTPGTRWHLWSASKSFTSTVIGRALHTGRDRQHRRCNRKVRANDGRLRQSQHPSCADDVVRHQLLPSSGNARPARHVSRGLDSRRRPR